MTARANERTNLSLPSILVAGRHGWLGARPAGADHSGRRRGRCERRYRSHHFWHADSLSGGRAGAQGRAPAVVSLKRAGWPLARCLRAAAASVPRHPLASHATRDTRRPLPLPTNSLPPRPAAPPCWRRRWAWRPGRRWRTASLTRMTTPSGCSCSTWSSWGRVRPLRPSRCVLPLLLLLLGCCRLPARAAATSASRPLLPTWRLHSPPPHTHPADGAVAESKLSVAGLDAYPLQQVVPREFWRDDAKASWDNVDWECFYPLSHLIPAGVARTAPAPPGVPAPTLALLGRAPSPGPTPGAERLSLELDTGLPGAWGVVNFTGGAGSAGLPTSAPCMRGSTGGCAHAQRRPLPILPILPSGFPRHGARLVTVRLRRRHAAATGALRCARCAWLADGRLCRAARLARSLHACMPSPAPLAARSCRASLPPSSRHRPLSSAGRRPLSHGPLCRQRLCSALPLLAGRARRGAYCRAPLRQAPGAVRASKGA